MFKIPLFGLSSVFYTSCTKKEPYLFIGKTHKFKNCLNLMTLNDDIAGFCGISTRHSVNRILRGLREEHVIRTLYNKIMVLDVEYLKQFVDVKVDA